MNKQIVQPVTNDLINDTGFALGQLMNWATRCYQLGAANMNATDAVAAANVSELLTTGAGRIECRIDLAGQVAQFVLHVDAAGEDAQELTLFSSSFEPTSTTH